MDRKGKIESAAIVGLITVLVVGIVMIVLVKNSAIIGANVHSKETCKKSVENYAKLKLPGIDLSSSDQIDCPTQSKTISNDEAREKIAKAMYECFDQFGAGELELFDTRRGSQDNYCIVCSKIEFTKTGQITGLAEYLAKTNIPGGTKTYYDYFKGEPSKAEETSNVNKGMCGSGFTRVPEKLADYDIVDASKRHAVIFTYAKATGWCDKILAGGAAGSAGLIIGGAVAGFFTGGTGWVVAAAAAGGTIGGGIGLAKAPSLQSEWQAGVLFLPYDEQLGQRLNCQEIPIRQ